MPRRRMSWLVLALTLLAGSAAQSLRGMTILGKESEDPDPTALWQDWMGWHEPDALLPFDTSDNDKATAMEYDVKVDGRIANRNTRPVCQWHFKHSYRDMPYGWINPHAVYYGQVLSRARANIAYKIKGRFPPTVYFSFQIYAFPFTGQVAQSIRDVKMQAHWGKNPFVDSSATPDSTGGYELYLTPSGSEGYPNELPLPPGRTSFLILRMYKPDPFLNETLRIDELEPPTLYVGQTPHNGGGEWNALPQCSETLNVALDKAISTFYEANYYQSTGTQGRGVILRDYRCPLSPERGNVSLVLFEGAWVTPQLQTLIARNSDSPYLFYCIDPDNNWEHYTNTVFKIRFKLPRIPDGLFSPVRVAEVGDYDVRFFSLSTAEGIMPQPVIQTIDGKGIKRHYHTVKGGLNNWDGYVDVRIARNEEKARECGLLDDADAVFLPLVSDRVHPAKTITLILRSILAHGPKTAGAASRSCNKTVDCGNPGFIRNVMGEYYPEMEVYHCEGGKMTRYADYFAKH